MIDLEVKGFIPNTMLDWEGMLASTVFLPRCNFRCPYCQNPDLVLNPGSLQTVPFSVISEFLRERDGWIDGVCITGGEPCLHKDLPEFCSDLKAEGVGVKLDTNGSFPDMLEGLISRGLIDFVAMDVKAPLEQSPYKVASGNDQHDLLDRVTESIDIIRGSGVEHEFRTTVVPIIHGPGEIERIAEYLQGEERYALQQFSPRDTLDPRFSELKPFTGEDMRNILKKVQRLIPGAVLRGASAGMEQ